ncbi:RDD family protein [Mycobacterium sp. CSUR Q5927]|nr:RDD family protein [Mycobacterium sp. CSUR Q5927]
MTEAVLDASAGPPARWRSRVIAYAVDLLPGVIVVTAMALAALSFPSGGAWWWVAMTLIGVVILATAINRVLLPAITGWSLGRAFAGLEVVRGGGTTEAVGAGRLLVREVAHLLDAVFLGWLWPLRDRRGRTFADLVARTEVRPAKLRVPPANIRLRAMAAFVVAGVLSLAGAAAAYAVVYRTEHNADQARIQIARQGPKIVADMLSYDPETLQDDFARAQALATDKYREQLVPQLDAIRSAKPVPNFYRVTDAAVLDAAKSRATMLLFLQGQRGTAGKERLISATVRVVFAKVQDSWRVDDLSVVSKPLPAEGDK